MAADFTITMPTGDRYYAFTPYYMGISANSEIAIGAAVTIEFNGFTIKRYLDTNRNIVLPLSGILQSYFAGVEFGYVLPVITSTYLNTASKLMVVLKKIKVTIGTVAKETSAFDVIWGALQMGESEPTVKTIYQFLSLPLTITQTIGQTTTFNGITATGYGKEVYLSDMGLNPASPLAIVKNSSNQTVKTYTVKYSPCVPDDAVYLRWIDIYGEYSYYLMEYAGDENTTDIKSSFYYNQLTQNPSASFGFIKNRVQVKEKTVNNKWLVGVMAADEELTKHLITLNMSLKQWFFDGTDWIECVVGNNTIGRRNREGLRQIDFEISMPEIYNQML